MIEKLENIVIGEIVSDFMEMSLYLIDNQLIHPAVQLLGAVLEESLRKICIKNAISFNSKKDKTFQLNEKLNKSSVYSKLLFDQINIWKDMRNEADQNTSLSFGENETRGMYQGMILLLNTYL